MPEALDLAHLGEDLALRERVVLVAADVDERPVTGTAVNERDRPSLDLEPADLADLEVAGRGKGGLAPAQLPLVTRSRRAATAAARWVRTPGAAMRAQRSSKKPRRMSRSATAGGTPRDSR